MRRLAVAILLLVAAVTSCGPGRLPYMGNDKLVATMGVDAAKERLRKLLSQAAAPQVNAQSIDIGRDYYFYQALDLAMFGRGFVSQKVFFDQVQKVEVWEDDGRHYCRLIGEKKLDQLRWSSAADAKEFADLVLSFRANLTAPAPAVAPPVPPGSEPREGEVPAGRPGAPSPAPDASPAAPFGTEPHAPTTSGSPSAPAQG